MKRDSIIETISINEMKRLWREELSILYVDTPRLYLLLQNTPLQFTHEGSKMLITFEVHNEAQKLWVERHLINELNNLFKEITGNQNLEISVCIEDKVEHESIYIIDTIPPHIPNDITQRSEINELEIDID